MINATWGNERSLSDRQNGAPVGLFRLTPKGSSTIKKYVVKILPLGKATDWCRTARLIVNEGDQIPKKVGLEHARREAKLDLLREEADNLPRSADKIDLRAEIREQEFVNASALDVMAEEMQAKYANKIHEHLFEYDPEALPKEEIMACNPDHSMVVSAFMRLFRFSDPSSCLATVVTELTKK